jgi:hypothetical protein
LLYVHQSILQFRKEFYLGFIAVSMPRYGVSRSESTPWGETSARYLGIFGYFDHVGAAMSAYISGVQEDSKYSGYISRF